MADPIGPYIGNPNIQRQAAKARLLAEQRIPENLPDPRTYGFVRGLLGTPPEELGMSAMSPNTAKAKEAAYIGGQISNAAQIVPALKGVGLLAANAINDAMIYGSGPLAAITPKPLGIFIGDKAKTWNRASNLAAQEMEKAGVDPREIWSKTMNWRAPDGSWRQEIPDNMAEFRAGFDASGASKANNYKSGIEGPIGGMYRHDELYKAYPSLLTTDRMEIRKLPEWMPDSANSGMYSRTFGGKGRIELANKTETGALDSASHELQHGIQDIEKFQGGATEGMFRDIPGGMTAFDQYRAQMGEAEARAAAARRLLDMEQRRNLFPEDSYDMPISGLLSR